MPPYLLKTLPGPYGLFRGGEVPEVTLAYETWGTLSAAKDNALLLTTGLSPGSHARANEMNPEPGWWEEMIGPERPLDTNRWFVVCNNSFGSCHGSTGPASTDPRTGRPYRLTFPCLSIEDIAITSRLLLKALCIERVAAVVGSSMGGMTALAYGALFPDEAKHIVSISASAHALPFAISLRSTQREAIRLDPDWRGGDYPFEKPPVRGMRLARRLGVTSYRSPEEWNERFGRKRVMRPSADPFGVRFEVEAYLEHQADKFVGTFDPNCYLYLSRAMDLFDLADHGTSLVDALRKLKSCRVRVIGVESDILFPVEQQRTLAAALHEAGVDSSFVRLGSIHGHDSFLIDYQRFAPAVGDFLKE
jgi:homoserine O-acetyltransferase